MAGVPLQQPSRAVVSRLIAVCRVVLAAFAVVAIFVDPDMAGITKNVRPIVVALMVYAFALLALSWRLRAPAHRLLIAIHTADFVLYTVMVYLTRVAGSPFFVFFVFLVFCAMFRFGTRAVISTGAAAAAVYVVLAFTQQTIRSDPGYVLLRVGSLGVITTLIAYVSAHQKRSMSDLQQLASWTAIVAPGGESVRDALARAVALLRAPRALAVWEAGEEPWVHGALLEGERFTTWKEGPELAEQAVAADLRTASFFAATPETVVIVDEANRTRAWRGQPLGDAILRRVIPRSILTAPFAGEVIRGRFFAFDAFEETTVDDLVLTRVAAGLVAARLAQIHSSDRLRETAVADERIRLARHLHDGLLQSLTVASLQIEVARRALRAGNPVDDRLVKIQELLEIDQRELRAFISRLRPGVPNDSTPMLHSRLASLAERFERQWHVEVNVGITPPAPLLPEGLAGEIYNLVS